MQGARYRRRRQRQDVNRLAQFFEPLFVHHAEPLLLIDDDEAQPLEADIFLQQPMRADDQIDAAVSKPGERGLLFGTRFES